MMKRHRHTALLAVVRLLFSAACAHAATVTPAAATNYLFTTPLRPAHIRGLVMGVPPAYYVPRSEDWDWLAEACAERNALASVWVTNSWSTALVPEFGSWGVAETNRFYKWVTAVDAAGVTNVVVGYSLVTNSPPSEGAGAHVYDKSTPSLFAEDYWLDGEVPLLSGSRGVRGDANSHSHTNVTYSQSYSNVVTNAFSTITIPMTNGTVSVHTNAWTANVTVPGEIHAITNVYHAELVDFCLADSPRRFPRAFDGVPELPGRPYASFLPVQDVLSNYYARLRLTVRMSEPAIEVSSGGVRFYDETYYSDGEYYAHDGVFRDYFRFERSYDGIDRTINYRRYAKSYDAVLTTSLPSALVTLGGTERVTIEAAFRVADVTYRQSDNGNYTNFTVTVFRRVSFPEHLTVTGTYATVSIRDDVLAQVTADINAAGYGIPNLPAFNETLPPGQFFSEYYYYGRWPRYLLIYRIHPTSKFTDW